MDQLAAERPDARRALHVHEAAYRMAAEHLGIAIRPNRSQLRCSEGDLADAAPNDESGLEHLAVVALSGRAALARVGADGDRDDCLARDLLFRILFRRYREGGLSPAFGREFIFVRMRELTARAEQLVAANWAAIEADAAALAAKRKLR